MYRDFDDAVDTVEDIVRAESIECDFVRSGKLKLAAKPEHFAGLVRTFETLGKDIDTGMELVDRARLASEIDSETFHGGLLQKKSAQMHVGRFGVGLAEAAARAGARVYESATGKSLQGAVVRVIGANATGYTDAEGRFTLPRLPAGIQRVEVDYVGLDPFAREISIPAGGAASLDASLESRALLMQAFTVAESAPTSEAGT
jgi:hypothetical protein